MFYNQPLVHRFGRALTTDITSGGWEHLEIAVAWVRRSGTRHIHAPVKRFLRSGGLAQVTVGIDIENTSREGLEDLLQLEADGRIETHVHHNEAGPTFHPKVYLLHGPIAARLIVGSNNLTEAGLFVNTEAGLQLDTNLSDPVVADARAALAGWRDTSTGLARRLDAGLLESLSEAGYILREADLRARRTQSETRKRGEGHGEVRLFRSQRVPVPPAEMSEIIPVDGASAVLLMRVRRASEELRRTQIQVPIRVAGTPFFRGVNSALSETSGRSWQLRPARARGTINTVKLELPEIAEMTDPVVRFERHGNVIRYRAFDGSSLLGAPIRGALLRGFDTTPPQTRATTNNRESATWWRFI